MDVNTFIQLVGSIGFPCVFCYLLFGYIKEEQAKLSDMIHEQTVAITKLTAYITGGKEDDDL